MWNLKRTALAGVMALIAVAGCTPDEYPSAPRFDVEPDLGPVGHMFVYKVRDDVAVTSVTIPGTLVTPNWDPPQSPALENAWQVVLDLDPGTYEYKYVFNTTDGWAGDMCEEGTWGHPDYGNSVDPDNADNCNGQNASIEIEEAGPHTFRYIVPDGVTVTALYLAGSFQGWTPADSPMYETYQLWMDLEPGSYEYKFHFNGADWAGNMCNDATWGDPDNGFMVDTNGTGCTEGGNGLLTID